MTGQFTCTYYAEKCVQARTPLHHLAVVFSEMLKLPIIARLQKASPWNVPSSGVKRGEGGGSGVRMGSGRSPFISRLQTPQNSMSHFAQVRHLTVTTAWFTNYCLFTD